MLKKFEPYDWQRECSAIFFERMAEGAKHFQVTACPGAGKTLLCLWLAKQAGYKFIVVVSPTSTVKLAWASDALSYFGVQLDDYPDWQEDHVGASICYGALGGGGHSDIRAQVGKHQGRGVIIFDECHHLGEISEDPDSDKTGRWAYWARKASEGADMVITTSGTPFRQDRRNIPFVKYDAAGVLVSDYLYDYSRAVRDGVCSEVTFPDYDIASCSWIDYGFVQEVETLTIKDEDKARKALRNSLCGPTGQQRNNFVETIIVDAHKYLLQLRERYNGRNVGGIIACIDVEHLKGVQKLLELNQIPFVWSVSSEHGNTVVEAFKESLSPDLWLLSVRQAMEGYNCPRAKAGVWLSNHEKELELKQFTGRFDRVEKDKEVIPGAVFMPKYPPFLRHALNIKNACRVDRETGPGTGGGPGPGPAGPGCFVLECSGELDGETYDTLRFTKEELLRGQRFREEFDSKKHLIYLVAQLKSKGILDQFEPLDVESLPRSLKSVIKDVASLTEAMARKIVSLYHVDGSGPHDWGMVSRKYNYIHQKPTSLDDHLAKRDWVLDWLATPALWPIR